MNRQRVTPSNSITVALQTFRDIDRKKLEKAEEEASLRRIKKLAMQGLPSCGAAGSIIMTVKSALGEDSE